MDISRRSLFKLFASGAASACVAGAARVAGAREAKEPLDGAVGMLYDSTMCIGCKACVVRCKEVNGLPGETAEHGPMYDAPDDLTGGTKNVIKLAVDGDKRAYVKAQCMHCVDPACVSVCMIGALYKAEGGIVAYDPDRCIGCRYCQIACPFEVPKFEWAKLAPKIVKCEMCRDRLAAGKLPGCVEVCPRKAVIYGKRADLIAEAHDRLAAHPDRYQPKVYGEHDGGGTQVVYLAAMAFDKLGLPDLGDHAPPEFSETIQHGIYKGFIAPVALYAVLGGVIWRNRKSGNPALGVIDLPVDDKEGKP